MLIYTNDINSINGLLNVCKRMVDKGNDALKKYENTIKNLSNFINSLIEVYSLNDDNINGYLDYTESEYMGMYEYGEREVNKENLE